MKDNYLLRINNLIKDHKLNVSVFKDNYLYYIRSNNNDMLQAGFNTLQDAYNALRGYLLCKCAIQYLTGQDKNEY